MDSFVQVTGLSDVSKQVSYVLTCWQLERTTWRHHLYSSLTNGAGKVEIKC